MKKIRLNVDALAVESFSPAGGAVQPVGTVRAHAAAFAGPNIPTLETGHHGCYACPGTGLPTCAACA